MPGYLVVPTIGFCALFLVSHAFWLMNSSSQIECAWSGVVAKKRLLKNSWRYRFLLIQTWFLQVCTMSKHGKENCNFGKIALFASKAKINLVEGRLERTIRVRISFLKLILNATTWTQFSNYTLFQVLAHCVAVVPKWKKTT